MWNSQLWKPGPSRINDEIWTHLCLVLMATSSTPRCSVRKVRKVVDKTAKGTPYHQLRNIGASSSDEPMIYESIKRLAKRKRTLSSKSSLRYCRYLPLRYRIFVDIVSANSRDIGEKEDGIKRCSGTGGLAGINNSIIPYMYIVDYVVDHT
jgi:hypothetical protein